jgi:NTP pyrophosphatase (non-canonical NTP hydrolase)
MKHSEVYRATLEKWGAEAQYDQAIEECAELITALKHLKRGKVDEDRVVAELADVYLMVGQLSYMFGPGKVEAAVGNKLDKLAGLLADEEGR